MNETTLALILSEHWPLSGVQVEPLSGNCKPLFQHSSRETLVVHSEQGHFVVKVFEDRYALGLVAPSIGQIEHQLSVFDYLAQRGYSHIPALLKTRTGQNFARVEGKTFYLMEQVRGTLPEASAQTWRELGQAAAPLRACSDYPHPYPIAVTGVIDELRQHAQEYPFADTFLPLVAGLAVLEGQPASLIHAEINIANAMRSEEGRMYLLDWDAVGHGPSVLMAGYPLIVCLVDEYTLRFHADWAAAFYEAYTAGEGMTEAEKELTFQAGLLHALRYLRYDLPRRWARVQFALANKALLLSTIPSR